jgi:serine phosphatase RsbU (regulator of sigma subunit)
VLLGDVIGAEAAAAAVLIGQVRHTVRGAAFFNRDPGELLRVLNATLTDSPERNDPARLLTAICVRVRSREGGKLAVTLAAAGHPQPMLVRGDGKVEEVPVTGRLCGALPSTAYEETAALLSGEDLLLLFTGGVPDAKGADGRFGRGRLAQLASGYAGAGAQALAEAVDIAVAEFSATDPAIPVDDVSVVALGPGGGSQR